MDGLSDKENDGRFMASWEGEARRRSCDSLAQDILRLLQLAENVSVGEGEGVG